MTCCVNGLPSLDSSVSLSGIPTGRKRERRRRPIAHSWKRRTSPTRASEAMIGEGLAVGEVWRELVVVHAERRADRHVHVEVLVGPETATEQDVGLALRELAIGQQP